MKSIEDYKNTVKILKVKVLKLQQQNEELKKMVSEKFDLNFIFDSVDNQDLIQTMKQFSANSKRIGITPEMMFRATDISQTGVISTKKYCQILGQLRLGLSGSQINLLVNLFDIDHSGTITRQEYHDSLEAFNVNTQNRETSFIATSFKKFAQTLQLNQLTSLEAYKKLDPRKYGKIKFEVFKLFAHWLKHSTLTEREIIAAYNYLDIEQNEGVTKDIFIKEIDKIYANVKKQGPTVFKDIAKPKIKLDVQAQKLKELQATLTRMAVLGINFNEFLMVVLQNIDSPGQGIHFNDFVKAAQQVNLKIGLADLLQLFRMIDLGENGSIDYDELMKFFLTFKKPEDNFDLLVVALARKLLPQYFALEDIDNNSELEFDEFYPIAKQLYGIPNEQVGYQLFVEMDKDKSGQVSTREMFRMIQETLQSLSPEELKCDEISYKTESDDEAPKVVEKSSEVSQNQESKVALDQTQTQQLQVKPAKKRVFHSPFGNLLLQD